VMSAVMPLQEAIDDLIYSMRNAWKGYIDLLHVRAENLHLRQSVDELQGKK